MLLELAALNYKLIVFNINISSSETYGQLKYQYFLINIYG